MSKKILTSYNSELKISKVTNQSQEVNDNLVREVAERKRNEEFVLELLDLTGKLSGMSHADFRDAVDLALSRIGNFLEADRAYVFEFEKDTGLMNNTYEWCLEGIEPQIDFLKDIPIDVYPEWMKIHQNHENVIIPDVSLLPDSWKVVRETLEPQGIRSLIAAPMFHENKLIGFIGLDSVRSLKVYSNSEIIILNIWCGILTNMINKYHTDLLLNITRQNFEAFFNTVDDFLWVLDESGRIVHVNNTVLDRLGYSIDELMDKSVLDVHPADRQEEAMQIVDEMLRGKAEYCPVPVVTKDGRRIPVETRVKVGYWNGKKSIFGVSKDISKLQLSEQKFSRAFQSGSALMAISDFETGEFIDVNIKFLESVAYEYQEIIGKTSTELGLYADLNFRHDLFQRLSSGVAVRDMEKVIIPKYGDLRILLLSADIIYLHDRKCILTVSVDITDRKKYEDEIKQAKTEAESANLAKSEFLSRMSHELRTPMNSILGFAQLLEMGDLGNAQKRAVNHILHSGKLLLNLINEVLDISRIEAGRLSLSLEPVNVQSLLREAIDLVYPLAKSNGIILEILPNEEPDCFVRSDKQSLKQILLNLLNNAIKYNKPHGKVQVGYEINLSNDTVRVFVKDTGLGIHPENINRIFTPFERIGAEKTQIEGTGLGLSVVQKLAEALQALLSVESVPEMGSTFRIDLPRDENQILKYIRSEMIALRENDSGKCSGNVLYIEDNDSNIELVDQILFIQRPGVNLHVEKYGRNTLKKALEVNPELILLDLNLPDIHGSEVLRHLKRNKLTSQIPVVVISADAMQDQIDQLIKAGAINYLTKPIDVESFLKIIDQFVS